MNYTIGKKYLITVDDWFLAPDGRMYRSYNYTNLDTMEPLK